MQITIKPTMLRMVAAEYVNQEIYHEYDLTDLKAAGVPKRGELIDGLLANKKFMRGVERYLSEYINDVYVIDDAFCSGEMNPAPLGKYVKKLDKLRKDRLDKEKISATMSK